MHHKFCIIDRKKPVIEVDADGVHARTIVKHKAFGMGEVKGIDGSRIVVIFSGKDKAFQFAGVREWLGRRNA